MSSGVPSQGAAFGIADFPPLPSSQRRRQKSCGEVLKKATGLRSGLCNLGNTCYMNAVTQAFLHVPQIESVVKQHRCSESCNQPCGLSLLQASEVATRNPLVPPVSLPCWCSYVAKGGRQFHKQQDSADIIIQLMDCLQQEHELKRTLSQRWDATIRRVPQCGCTNAYEYPAPSEIGSCVALAIPDNPGVRAKKTPACTLLDLLSAHCDWQPIDDGESYTCSACGAAVPGLGKFQLAAAGGLLCIEIKRFRNSISKAGVLQYKRVETAVGLPLELRLAGQDYQLQSVIMHSGPTPYCGHYCAAIADEQRWLVYDDTRVSESRSIPSEAERACVFVVYVRHRGASMCSERTNTGIDLTGGCVSIDDADPSTGEACGTSVGRTRETGQSGHSDTHVELGEAPSTNQDADSCAEVPPAASTAQRVVSEGECSESRGDVGRGKRGQAWLLLLKWADRWLLCSRHTAAVEAEAHERVWRRWQG